MRDAKPLKSQPYAGDRLVMEVVGFSGRASEIEFKFRRDSVEILHHEHCCAVLDRDLLRQWLMRPWGPLVVDEIRIGGGAGAAMTLSLPGVPAWTLSLVVLAQLRQRV